MSSCSVAPNLECVGEVGTIHVLSCSVLPSLNNFTELSFCTKEQSVLNLKRCKDFHMVGVKFVFVFPSLLICHFGSTGTLHLQLDSGLFNETAD